MTDLRQGVSPIQHAVLDRVEKDAGCRRLSRKDWVEHTVEATLIAQSALKTSKWFVSRNRLIAAAARLILAAEQLRPITDDEVPW